MTITLFVSAAGSLIPLADSIGGGGAVSESAALATTIVHALALACVLLLWTPAATTWVKQEAQA